MTTGTTLPRRRRRVRLGISICLAALSLGILPEAPAQAGTVRVKYRSSSHVYLDAGETQGLKVGDRLVVRSASTVVAELEVVFVARNSASCRVLSEKRPLKAGDVAEPLTRPAQPEEDTTPPEPPTQVVTAPGTTTAGAQPAGVEQRRPRRPWGRARGALSFGYYKVVDETASAFDFEQRTARLDVTVTDLGDSPYALSVRARRRQDLRARTVSTATPADVIDDRLYELALRYQPDSDSFAFGVGRIGSAPFVGIGYLDGLWVRGRLGPGFQAGAFVGRHARVRGSLLDEPGQKYGVFVRMAPGEGLFRHHDTTLAMVREFADSDVSREYVSLESRFGHGSRWSFFQRAELDLNRGWREAAAGTRYQISNVSLAARARLGSDASASVSYDGRRNYRSHVNRRLADAVFDDLLRQGLRARLTFGGRSSWQAEGGFGARFQQDQSSTYSWNAGLRRSRLAGSGLWIGLKASGFTGAFGDGLLLAGNAGLYHAAGHSARISYGRSQRNVALAGERRATRWLRFFGYLSLRRGVFVSADGELASGDDLQGPRGLLEVGYRF